MTQDNTVHLYLGERPPLQAAEAGGDLFTILTVHQGHSNHGNQSVFFFPDKTNILVLFFGG